MKPKEYILSENQKMVWLASQLNPEEGRYNVSLIWDILQFPILSKFHEATEKIVLEQPILRTTYFEREGVPFALEHDYLPYGFEEIDSSSWTSSELQFFLEAEPHRPIDLSKEVFRWVLIRREEKPIILCITFHHIASDLTSFYWIMKRLQFHLTGQNKDKLSFTTYRTFIDLENDESGAEKGELEFRYWSEKLSGRIHPAELSIEKTRLFPTSYKTRFIGRPLPRKIKRRLDMHTKGLDVSSFQLYLGSFIILMAQISSGKELRVGIPVQNRVAEGFKDTVGFFANSFPLCYELDPNQEFPDFLGHLRELFYEDWSHCNTPFIKILERLNLSTEKGRNPGFDVMFTWEDMDVLNSGEEKLVVRGSNETPQWMLGPLKLEQRSSFVVSPFDLCLKVDVLDGHIAFRFEYNPDLYSKKTVEGLLSNYIEILENIAHNPVLKLKELVSYPSTFIQRESGALPSASVPELPLVQIKKQVDSQPQVPALWSTEGPITYQEMENRSTFLAKILKENGSSPGTIIGLFMDNHAEAVISILAIMKTGAAYVPVSPIFPQNRISYLLEDCDVKLVVTDVLSRNSLPIEYSGEIIIADQLSERTSSSVPGQLPNHPDRNDLAYVLYTSGSTGKPKGVLIEQNALAHLLDAKDDIFEICSGDRVLQFFSLSFDASVSIIFLTLSSGGTLFFADSSLRMGGSELADFLVQNKIKIGTFTPSVLATVPELDSPDLKTVYVGGEAVPQELAQQWGGKYVMVNGYGPTENTVISTVAVLDGSEKPTIGKPIRHVESWILNDNGLPVPIGVPGELYLSGKLLARGYRNLPERTDRSFIEHPYASAGGKLYRTGDRAAWLPNGQIDYLGRLDSQVKLRGIRIELGEIENVMKGYPGVEQATVMKYGSSWEDEQLIGYFTETDSKVNPFLLRKHLAESLPAYMIPTHFLAMIEFPLNDNGKLDRNKLPEPNDPDLAKKEQGSMQDVLEEGSPRKVLSEKLINIWSQVLGSENFETTDNFFEVGGHSLLLNMVFSLLPDEVRKELRMVDLYHHSSIKELAEEICKRLGYPEETIIVSVPRKINLPSEKEKVSKEIAIIGIGGRFPNCVSKEEFWQKICEGESMITSQPGNFSEDMEENGSRKQVFSKGTLEGVESFDSPFFGINSKDADIMDPQQRIFLECCWEAFEDAGVIPEKLKGVCGVYAGIGFNYYLYEHLQGEWQAAGPALRYRIQTLNDNTFLATRIAYQLDLEGPAITIQTACSSSLSAVHTACEALVAKKCDFALAGGVSLMELETKGYMHQKGMITSSDGVCRPFDSNANGIVPGQGAGVVLLKRLEEAIQDQDPIHAVIRGSAINNDGRKKVGYSAPSVKGQSRVLKEAILRADISPDQVAYIETHGTGTRVGDPIEFESLRRIYGDSLSGKNQCALGAVKANIGHTDAASGVIGLIKTAFVLRDNIIPPQINFEKPNPELSIENSPFYIPKTAIPNNLKENDMGAVSSFGIGGTNVHIILKRPPIFEDPAPKKVPVVLCLSAKYKEGIKRYKDKLKKHLEEQSNARLADIAHTLQTGRKHFGYRTEIVSSSVRDAIKQLSSPVNPINTNGKPPKIGFLFPGQGSQFVDMGKGLFHLEPLFQKYCKQVFGLAKEKHKLDIESILFPEIHKIKEAQTQIKDTLIAQFSLFAIEYSLAKTLIDYGIKPDVMIGHSFGELVAAAVSGVFPLEDALQLIYHRGNHMNLMQKGGMVAIRAAEKRIGGILRKKLKNHPLSIAGINSPVQTVVSGKEEDLKKLEQILAIENLNFVRLNAALPFHSSMMDPMLSSFTKSLGQIKFNSPQIPFVSNVTGKPIKPKEAKDPEYWAKQVRATVQFGPGVKHMFSQGKMLLFEVGPGDQLGKLAKQSISEQSQIEIMSILGGECELNLDFSTWKKALGKAWSYGIPVNWEVGQEKNKEKLQHIPTYPFQKIRHWVGAKSAHPNIELNSSNKEPQQAQLSSANLLDKKEPSDYNGVEQSIIGLFEELLGHRDLSPEHDFFSLGGDSLVSIQLSEKIERKWGVSLDAELFQFGSKIKQIAHCIKEKMESDLDPVHSPSKIKYQSLKILKRTQSDGEVKNLFLPHPWGGHLFWYQDLIRFLPSELRVIGFKAVGLDEENEPHETVEEMANAYVKELLQLQPKGPYYLGGSSMGGMIAFEMAEILTEMGEQISLLFMIDTPGPGQLPAYLKSDNDIFEYLKMSQEKGLPIEKKSQGIGDWTKTEVKSVLGKGFIDVILLHAKATYDYRPRNTQSGRLIYFKAAQPGEVFQISEKPWQAFLHHPIEVLIIGGNHFSMNFGVNARGIAKFLNKEFSA